MDSQIRVVPTKSACAMPRWSKPRMFHLRHQSADPHAGLAAAREGSGTQVAMLQRQQVIPAAPSFAPPVVYDVLRSPGQPLDAETRAFFEPRFGYDFSQVQVHADEKAAQSARAVRALAYTVGNQIVFGRGQYQPATSEGRMLLSHELVHVGQQRGVAFDTGAALEIGARDSLHEREAEAAAKGCLEGSRPPGESPVGQPTIQRQYPADAPLSIFQAEPVAPLPISTENIELDAFETISPQNTKLAHIAQTFKGLQAAHPDAMLELEANLTEASRLNGETESKERRQLTNRMSAIRNALVSLGVPANQISMMPVAAYSTSAHGQVDVALYESRGGAVILPPYVQPTPLPPPSVGAPQASSAGGLTFTPGSTWLWALTLSTPKPTPPGFSSSATSPSRTFQLTISSGKQPVQAVYQFTYNLDSKKLGVVTVMSGVQAAQDIEIVKGFLTLTPFAQVLVGAATTGNDMYGDLVVKSSAGAKLTADVKIKHLPDIVIGAQAGFQALTVPGEGTQTTLQAGFTITIPIPLP